MNSVKKNFSYNIIYQILTLILPLITAPYISRTLGAKGQGIFSYTYSFATYFVLFAMLGINNYGNRTIAKNKENSKKLSKEFCTLYTMQFISAIIAIFLYIIYIFVFGKKYQLYFLLQLIFVFSSIFDINWFFFGLEKFKLTIIRNIIIKLLSVVLIFLFVKNDNDLSIYIVIMASSTLLSNLFLWPYLFKQISFTKISLKDIIKHIKPNIMLFIPVIAVSLYKIMDKIMLGNMANMTDVGFYENAEKIINIPLSFITALGTVMLPRISNLISLNEDKKILNYIDKSMEFVLFISVAFTFGLLAIGKNFSIIFFGNKFTQTGNIIQLLAPTILFISCANVIRTQFLIPKEKDKIYIISVFIGAIVNFIINFILIPKYGSTGAAIGTIFAEFFVMFYQMYKTRKELEILKYIKLLIKFSLSGFTMFAIINILIYFIRNKYILLAVQIILGCLIYFILNYKYISKVIPFNKIKSISKLERRK